jgi:hypothetical protein
VKGRLNGAAFFCYVNCRKVCAGGTFVYLCRTTNKQMPYFTLTQRTALAYDYQQWATQFDRVVSHSLASIRFASHDMPYINLDVVPFDTLAL